ncbi:nucleotidyl transferase AbiEii/AbiGii toxin family protein [Candidatus Woesearchaeota archaeon]|nr:nucleotidyl transferase AbiEii/AbiGii toxin family protein [Candidatus Woesearchaeota archaeon]
MITKEFVDYIGSKTKIEKRELIEKDFLLQELLLELQKEKYFRENFVFKGGTCLIKCYLGYFRFSEDLDFSFIKQNLFKNKSENQIRKLLSKEINIFLNIIEEISKKIYLDFKSSKGNRKYIELGGNNKFLTLKLWYKSQILNEEQFIKIQINFVDLFKYKFKRKKANSISKNINIEETKFLFPEYVDVATKEINIVCYDLKEILLEKFRALLTRKGVKARDFIDIYFILKYLEKDFKIFKKDILDKTVFMLRYYKYKRNLLEKEELLKNYEIKEVEKLLLIEPDKDFYEFNKKLATFVNGLIVEIKGLF